MAWRPKIRNHASIVKYHPEDPYAQSKTESQWLKEGRVVVGSGLLMFTNSNYAKAIYYLPEETREASKEELDALKAQKREEKRKREHERMEKKRAAEEAEKARRVAQMARLRRYADIEPADIVCLDTETTGVGYDDEILQLSIINGRGEVLFNEYIHPTMHEEWPEAECIHGISPAMVAGTPAIAEYLPRINEIISTARLIVGYNLGFDLDFIRRAGIAVPDSINQFDCMPEFAEIYGEWNSYYRQYKWQQLCVCADFFGYEGTGFHDSLEDVRATLHCYFAMTEYNYGRE